ncbi:MAG: tetratricopeptide repeat protein [Gloeobacteraceae cyanobacterium ES-bin-316]|nr:tetratricopeptide repeat protein [Ferruginibacter sp.]
MKVLLCLLLAQISLLHTQSQVNRNSLQATFDSMQVNKVSLQDLLDRTEVMPIEDIETIRIIGDWVIMKSTTDSLLEINATAYLMIGKRFTITSNFAEATRYLTRAQSISETNNFPQILAQALNVLGSIYRTNDQEDKAIKYFKQSLAISKKNNYLHGLARSSYNLGTTQLVRAPKGSSKANAALQLIYMALDIVKKLKDTPSIIVQTRGLANVYINQRNYDAALLKLQESEQLIRLTGKEFDFVIHYNQVAKIYNDKKKYATAIQYYKTGLELAEKYKVPRLMCMYYAGMAETYEKAGNYKKANRYNQLNIQMHDALVSKENFAAAADIQNRYEAAKKDNELLKMAAINKQRNTVNSILIAATLGLLLLGLLGYKNFKSRSKVSIQQQELQLQKIIQLEKDKQIISIDAMLKGQEEERSRIAKDLHDGIGSLLSGTKLSFMNVREMLSLKSGKAIQFDKSLSMLDNTIGDLRKVAQNLMPEALVKFGLYEALRDLCDTVQTSSGIKIVYQSFGEKRILDNTAVVFIYRIVQELVNNVVKHANASEVIVQLSMTDDKTVITVEDNGKGFDKSLLLNSTGAGMSNIHFRVQYFNGTSDILTSAGHGTSINIELKV